MARESLFFVERSRSTLASPSLPAGSYEHSLSQLTDSFLPGRRLKDSSGDPGQEKVLLM